MKKIWKENARSKQLFCTEWFQHRVPFWLIRKAFLWGFVFVLTLSPGCKAHWPSADAITVGSNSITWSWFLHTPAVFHRSRNITMTVQERISSFEIISAREPLTNYEKYPTFGLKRQDSFGSVIITPWTINSLRKRWVIDKKSTILLNVISFTKEQAKLVKRRSRFFLQHR